MIEFKNIEIKYGDFVAIKDLNLTVGDGEFFTFLGPSGCGRTTTLRALVGFLEPSAGHVAEYFYFENKKGYCEPDRS